MLTVCITNNRQHPIPHGNPPEQKKKLYIEINEIYLIFVDYCERAMVCARPHIARYYYFQSVLALQCSAFAFWPAVLLCIFNMIIILFRFSPGFIRCLEYNQLFFFFLFICCGCCWKKTTPYLFWNRFFTFDKFEVLVLFLYVYIQIMLVLYLLWYALSVVVGFFYFSLFFIRLVSVLCPSLVIKPSFHVIKLIEFYNRNIQRWLLRWRLQK